MRRRRARELVPRAAVLAHPFEQLEISAPRPFRAYFSRKPHKTLPMQVLQRAQVAALRGFVRSKHLQRTPRLIHRVAHPTTHLSEACDISGVRQVVVSSQNMSDDIECNARDALGLVRGMNGILRALSLARINVGTVGGHHVGCWMSCACRCGDGTYDPRLLGPRRLKLLKGPTKTKPLPLVTTTSLVARRLAPCGRQRCRSRAWSGPAPAWRVAGA